MQMLYLGAMIERHWVEVETRSVSKDVDKFSNSRYNVFEAAKGTVGEFWAVCLGGKLNVCFEDHMLLWEIVK